MIIQTSDNGLLEEMAVPREYSKTDYIPGDID